jgi:glutathione S-transferase
MAELTLVGDSTWISPWVFHVMVALEEKKLPYDLELVPLPIPDDRKVSMLERSPLAKVPMLLHGNLALTESLAISEYLAETFPAPRFARLFPADLGDRARARQIMSYLRTALFALRKARPTTSVFGKENVATLEGEAKTEAADLIRIATMVLKSGRPQLFEQWCIADADLALALQRLVNNGDEVPPAVAAYAKAQWERPSVRAYLSRVPTSR